MKIGDRLRPDILECIVKDQSGYTHPMDDCLRGPTLLVFLRHFGCIGCAAHITALSPRFREFIDKGIRIVFIGNGATNFIAGFKERFNLEDTTVTIVTDPSLKVYDLANLNRSIWGTIGVRAIIQFAKSLANGLSQKEIAGSNTQQGGTILIDADRKIEFYHQSQYLGDNSDPDEIMKAATKIFLAKKMDGKN